MIGLKNWALRARAALRVSASPAARLGWVLLLPGLGLAGAAQAQSCGVGEVPAAFGFTGGEQTTTVPAGVHSLTVYLSGAQGGAGRSGAGTIGGSPNSPGGAGGLGGRVRGTLAVTPGATLSIWVGGQGSQAVNPGGIGEGVDGIGGGATDLRVGGNGIGNRVGIAGGGGGGGNAGWSTANVIAGGAGGVGGGGTGGAGATVPGGAGPFGGGGGTVGTGGAAGGGCGSFPATAGNAANGNGGDAFNFSGSFVNAGYGGGGGGGATVGAGGGGAGVGTVSCQQNWNGGGGGGAGGSSGATGLTAVTINNGVQAGNGAALICFAPTQFAVGGTAAGQTGPVTLQLAGTNPVSSQQVVVAQAATTFVFPTRLPQGANWTVSVLSAPAGQQCTVAPASGLAINADVTNVALSCVTVAVTVNPAALPNGAFGTAYSQTLTATSANGGTAPYTFAITAGALPPGLTLSSGGVLSGTPTAAGSFNFTVRATSSNNFSGTRAYTVAIAQNAQAITAFASNPVSPVYAPGGTFTVSATGGASGNPVVFASTTPAVCTVAGSTVTMVAAGNCALTANQAGNANYSAAPQANLAVTIATASQAITAFASNPASPVYTPGGTFTVSATGGASGNPVVFASTTAAVCTVAGSTVTMVSAGNCALTANQAGNANYSAAPQANLAVTIGLANQAITGFAANPAAPVYTPGGTFALSATGGASGNPVVFASTTPAVCTVAGGTATIVAAGTCSLTANQAGNANYNAAPQVGLAVVIGVGTQAINNFAANPASPVYAPGGTFAISATPGASTSPVVFATTTPSVCSVAGSTVTMLAAGTCSLTADQAADPNYAAAPQVLLDVAITVASQAITDFAANPASPVYAPGGTFAVSATPGASTSPVVFASTTASVCTVSGSTVTMLTAGTCSLTADQAADANYSAAPQVTLDVTIGAAAQAISNFSANPSAPVYSVGGTFAVSASGGASGNPVVFASTSPAVCTVSGGTVTMLASGTCSLTADQAGNGNYSAAPQVALQVLIGGGTPTLAWIGDVAKTIGEPSFDLPNPTSNSSGAFTFSSGNTAVATVSGRTVTIVGAGVATLVATQAAAGSYLQTTISATLTVADRPDPTRDPSVVGGLQAQVDASVRFASAQQSNIHDRLRQQRFAGANSSSDGLSLNLSNRSGGAMSLTAGQVASVDNVRLPEGWGLWTAGSITNGQREPNSRSDGFDFQSDGITVGADWRMGERFLLGVAGGFGWNDTDLDDGRSKLDAKQRALSLYGLWRPSEHWFVDGIIGWGRLDFDIRRYSATALATATAERDGDQVFGSLTAGYEHHGDGMTLTGYGRFDTSRTKLDGYREHGLGIYDLNYGSQTVENNGASLGLEGSFPIVTTRGSIFRPYWMVEYRESLDNRSDVALNYVVMPVANDYSLSLRSYGDNALTYGAGMDMDFRAGWKLSLLMRRQHGDGQDPSTSFGLLLSFSPSIQPSSLTAPTAQEVAEQMDATASTKEPQTGR
ncbi:autotransporter beta-domain protein [Lysobacter capsici]|uniref:autotransporter domain-containing protein n=1 Tax=Lysobacter capsici TaxID=435897 RepID=UPI00071672C3|nr:autotransporter domain-containing protein [Lysobacter capsici]ALN86626.1 autotransporter beta-domain protein [Lysobacter capsici]